MAEPDSPLRSFSDRMKDLYWKQKDLPNAIRVAQEGIVEGLAEAARDPGNAAEIMHDVKGLYYDIASFTWPGWDEEGISPTEEEVSIGLAAARENLRYAAELNRGDMPNSRAHWLLGAHLLTAGFSDEARREFEQARTFAGKADSAPDESLNEGFALLASRSPETGAFVSKMEAEDFPFFAGQIRSAAKVLGVHLS